MFVAYTMTTEGSTALKAIADLGMAELYLHRGQIAERQRLHERHPRRAPGFLAGNTQTEGEIEQVASVAGDQTFVSHVIPMSP